MTMYFVDFAKRLSTKGNVGILVYLVLNTLLVVALFSNGFANFEGVLFGIVAYVLSLVIALSPIGEWILRRQTGSKKITRKEYQDRLFPLFAEVLEKARKIDPSIPKDVQLFLNDDKHPNAFATGRKTICLTKGFLNYSDEEIKATFAHELGHLAHKDTDLILIITIGNFIVTGFFIVFRFLFYLFAIMSAFVNRSLSTLFIGIFVDVIFVGMMWVWTKIGTLLVMHSKRQAEYLADEFAYKCGYGNELASVLDSFEPSGAKGLWANLASTHPESDDRIAKLQNLGSTYYKAV